jgi:hypothetical protein
MKRWPLVVVLTLIALTALSAGRADAQSTADERRALRARIEQRFDVVPLTDGVALRPKTRVRDVRLIEVTDDAILVNGVAATGRELRERLGADADLVLRLSYLDAAARRAIVAPDDPAAPPDEPVEARPEVERPSAPAPGAARVPGRTPPEDLGPPRRSTRERVRIFGDVFVREDERVSGQVVSVLGSVRVDGEVGDQVVAVMGSVDLGPRAIVRGDVISVGGRVRRAEGAQIRGAVTEVSLADPNVRLDFIPVFDWHRFWMFNGWGAVPRLLGTAFRFTLLVILAALALVIARPTVEASAHRVADTPVQSTLVGLAAWVLVWPLLFITAFVLAVSLIGIPLLLLLPFVVLLLLMLALGGFSGVALAVGQWARRRFGIGSPPGFLDLFLGILVILLPVLVARLIALAGWPVTPIAVLLIVIGVGVEFVAWSAGFGAVLTNTFSRWQARRASRQVVVSPPPV